MNHEQEKLSMSAGRLEALGDGIFSVVMTVMVIELRIPEVHGNSLHDFLSALYQIRQEMLCFLISFIVLGIMWFGHRMVFEYISKTNRYFIFLGVLFYMIVCLVPFSTKFLAVNTLEWGALVTYGVNLSMCNLSLFAQWKYGIGRSSLHARIIPGEIRKEARFLFIISPLLYSVAIVFAFFQPWVSIGIYCVTPVLYLIPNKLDKYLP